MEDPLVLGIIPARGGSKRLPRKNIMPVHGHPLIAYTIKAAQDATKLTNWLVSTEDEEIADVARSYGARRLSLPATSREIPMSSATRCPSWKTRQAGIMIS
jgi:CMP-N-acetylneuraminic acid synthetase